MTRVELLAGRNDDHIITLDAKHSRHIHPLHKLSRQSMFQHGLRPLRSLLRPSVRYR
jgi:hypothetical protein